jgi:hypothetical protein
MNRVTFPLKLSMQGSTVADLQEALRLLLDRNVIRTFDSPQSSDSRRTCHARTGSSQRTSAIGLRQSDSAVGIVRPVAGRFG